MADRTRRVAKPVSDEEEIGGLAAIQAGGTGETADVGSFGASRKATGFKEPGGGATQLSDLKPGMLQNTAVAYALWTQDNNPSELSAVGFTSRAKAFAVLNAPVLAQHPELEELFRKSPVAYMAAQELQQAPLGNVLFDRILEASDDQLRDIEHFLETSDRVKAAGDYYDAVVNILHDEGVSAADITAASEGFSTGEGQLAGNLNITDIPISDALQQLEANNTNEAANALAVWGDRDVHPDAQASLGSFFNDATGKPFVWVKTPDRLVTTFTTNDGDKTFDIRLDSEVGDTPLDIIGAIIEALWGEEHQVVNADKLPGGQNLFGGAIEFFGAFVNPLVEFKDNNDGFLNWMLSEAGNRQNINSSDLVDAEARRVADRFALSELYGDDIVLAGFAGLPTGSTDYLQAAQDTLAWYSDDIEGREEVERHLRNQREEISDTIDGFKDDRHSLERFLEDQILLPVGDAAVEFERFAQGNVVMFLDFFGDAAQGLLEATRGFEFSDPLKAAGDFVSAFEFNASDAFIRGDTTADYLGLADSDFAGTINLLASFAGDPGTWLLASGPLRRAAITHAMSSATGVDRFMRGGIYRRWVGPIKEYSGTMGLDNDFSPALLGMLSHDGISAEAMDRLFFATTGAEVDTILRNEMIYGNLIPTLTGGLKLRNTAQWAANLSKSGNSEAHAGLKRLLGQLSNDTRISLSPDRFMTDGTALLMAMSADGVTTPEAWRTIVRDFLRANQTTNRGWASAGVAMEIEPVRAARRALGQESRDNGYQTFRNAERGSDRFVTFRIRSLEADRARLSQGTDIGDELRGRLDVALADNARLDNASTRQALDDARRAVDRAEGTADEHIAAIDRELELLRDGDGVLGRATADDAAQDFGGRQAALTRRLDEVNAQIDELDEIPDELLAEREVLMDELAAANPSSPRIQAEVDAVGARYRHGTPGTAAYQDLSDRAAEWSGRWNDNTRRLGKLERTSARLQQPASNEALQMWVLETMQDWGERLGVPFKEGSVTVGGVGDVVPHSVLPNRYELDWGIITGVESNPVAKMRESLLRMLARGADGEIDLERLQALRATMTVADATSVQLDVSPMMLVAWANRPSGWSPDEWMRRFLYVDPARRSSSSVIGRGVAKSVDGINAFFAANVLMNPVTWFRSNLDEVFRHIIEGGFFGRATDVPGTGVASALPTGEAGRLIGPVAAGRRRLGATVRGVFNRPAANEPAAAAFYRNRMERVFTTKQNTRTMVTQTKTTARQMGDDFYHSAQEFIDSAEHLFNGVLPNREIWAKYAEAIHFGDEKIFFDWFANDGGRLLPGVKMDLTGGISDMARFPNEVFDGLNNTLEVLLSQVDAASRPAVRREILAHWAGAGPPIRPGTLRQFQFLPAARSSEKGMFNPAFDLLYGRPADAHGGLVFTDFYEQAVRTLTQRHQNRGRYLDDGTLADLLAQGGVVDEAALVNARVALSNTSPVVDDIVQAGGYQTQKSIHVAAARLAKAHADHLAYVMATQSLIGKRLAQQSPFLRAQMDFAGFYGRELTNGLAVGLNPRLAKILNGMGLKNAGNVIETAFPLNARLATRMADLYGGVALAQDDDEEADRDPFLGAMDTFTFLPSDFDESLWMQIIPGEAPLLADFLHALPVEGDGTPLIDALAAARGVLESISPAFGFHEEQTSLNPFRADFKAFKDLFGFIATDSQRTLSRATKRSLQAGINTVFSGSSVADFTNTMLGAPPGLYNAARITYALSVAEQPLRILDPGSADTQEWHDEVLRQSLSSTSLEALKRTASDWLGGFLYDADDGEYLQLYEGWVDSGFIDDAHAAGWLGDEAFDTIMRLWPTWKDRSISRTEANLISNRLSDLLFEGIPEWQQPLLVLEHPELVGNMVSQWKCTEDAPSDVCVGDRFTSRNPEVREQGLDERWLVKRSPDELGEQMLQRYATAAREARRLAWTSSTGNATWTVVDRDAENASDTIILSEGARMVLPLFGVEPKDSYRRYELNQIMRGWGIDVNTYTPAANVAEQRMSLDGRNRLDEARDGQRAQGLEWDPENMEEVKREWVRGVYLDELKLAMLTDGEQGITPSQYSRYLEPVWGEIGWVPPEPPDLESLPVGEGDGTLRLPVDRGFIRVVDGDTIAVQFYNDAASLAGLAGKQLAALKLGEPTTDLEGGDEQRVRFIGFNAQEVNHELDQQAANAGVLPEYLQQTEDLRKKLDEAESIELVIFDAENMPVKQQIEDEVRWLMVLYLDGVAQWDSSVFSSDNPSGAGVGGTGIAGVE